MSRGPASPGARALLGAALAAGVSTAGPLRRSPALQRTNHRGAVVSLASGPALALGAVTAATLPLPAVATAGLVAGAVGAYDDTAGARPAEAGAKGFRGHLAALRGGRITAGTVKVVGIGLAGLAGVALLPRPAPAVDLVLGGAIVAGTANLVNLLDLRAGRALKCGIALALALGQPGVAGAAAVLLPEDLAERTMLGDTGANALGAVLGLALVDRLPGRRAVATALAVLGTLTAASEVVSYSWVIDATPPLRWLDRLGRLP
ncbi:MAG TPA: hypothetical protein VFR07_16600 [Mycobacteriales bacterium]|jgi:hypothetical protein|nr:hypothetical protein [Mycobacteriales bacterium]